VCIVCTKIQALIAADFLEADPDISLQIFNEVTYVDGTVGVG
jgi:hypothetical protein